MVRLRGMPRLGPQGRGMGRPMPRLMRPEPPISLFSMPRGRLVRGRPGPRPGPPRSHLPPPRMAPPRLAIPPPLPPRRLPIPPRPPLPPRELAPHMGRPFPPRRPLPPLPHGPRPGMLLPPIPPRPMPPGPQLRRPIRPGPPFIRGRGAMMRGVKRLGTTTNGRVKKPQKRKEKTEEMETNKPWVTEALKVEIHKKYQLHAIAQEKKTESDWQAYKDQRILVGKMTNTAKLEYIGSHPDADVNQIMFGAAPK